MKLNGCKETEPVEVSAEAQRPMMTSSVFAEHVRGVTPHNAKSTEILATDTMAHGTMEIGHGKFRQASAQRILNLDRQDAGSDRLRPTW